MNLRKLINDTIMLSDLDDEIYVKIRRRDQTDTCQEIALVPISNFDSFNNLCVEERDIKWKPYTSDSDNIAELQKEVKQLYLYGKSAYSLEWIYLLKGGHKDIDDYIKNNEKDYVSFQYSTDPLGDLNSGQV